MRQHLGVWSLKMWFLLKFGGFKGQTWDRGRSEPALHTTSNPFHGKKTCITTLTIRIKQNWSKNRGIPQQIMISGAVPQPGTEAPPCQGIPAAFHADTLVAAWPERRPRATADVASPGTPVTGLWKEFFNVFLSPPNSDNLILL